MKKTIKIIKNLVSIPFSEIISIKKEKIKSINRTLEKDRKLEVTEIRVYKEYHLFQFGDHYIFLLKNDEFVNFSRNI